MPILRNPQTGEIVIAADPTGALQQGFALATDEEADEYARQLDYGTAGQQALAQGERVVRGATLGAVDGFSGSDADVRGREEVSREQHPVLSFAADVAPDVGVAALTGGLGGLATGAGRAAARGALAEGAGALKAGLSAARAGGATALAAESVGTGLVGAGQAAHAEGSYLGEDLGRDAENVLLWGGLNFGLGAFGLRSAARLRAGTDAAETGARELDDVARAAELEGASKNLPAEDVEAATALDSLLGGRDLSSVQQSDVPARELLRSQKLAGDAVDIEPPVRVGVGRSELPDLPESALAIPTDDVFSHANSMPVPEGGVNLVQERLSGPLGKTPGGFFKGSDGQIRYIKADKDPAHSALEVGNSKMYQALGRKTPELDIVELQDGTRAVSSVHLGKEWVEIDKLPDWSVLPASVKESYARGVPIDIIMGNWDVSRNARNIMTDGVDTLMVDAGEAATNAWGAKWFAGNEAQTAKEIRRTSQASHGMSPMTEAETLTNPTWGPYVGSAPPHRLLDEVGQTEGRMAQLAQEGFDDAMARIAEHGGPEEFIRAYQPTLSPDELARAAAEMTHRIDALQVAIPTLGAVLYAAFGGEGEGVGAAAGVGALGLLLGKRGLMGKGLRGAAGRQAERQAADEGLSRAVRAASKADAEDIVTSAIGEATEREASGFGRQRRLYQNRVAVMDAAEREFRGDLNGAMGELQKVVKGEKQAVVAGKVSANEGAQRAVAYQISKDAANFAGELRGEARAYAQASGKTGVQFPIPGAKSLASALMDHAKAVSKATDGKAMFSALDDFKRAAQDIKVSLEAGALNSTNPIHHQQLIPRIDTFERKIRDALEDSNTWGQAGEMQRAYNGVISDKLMPSLRIFEESVMERTHRGYDGIWKMEGWENKIKGLLANTDPGRRRHTSAVFDAMDELASVRRQFGDAKTAERLSTAAGKMRRTIGLADEVAEASKTVEDLGSVAGAVPLFGGMIREAVTGRLAGAVDRLMGASDAAATRGVDDWIRSSRARGSGLRAKLPKLSELSPEAKQLRDAAVRRGVSQGMALFMGEDETPSAAFERQRDALISDDGFFQSLNDEYGDLQQESPELFMALSGRAALARGFLLERMPPNVAVSMARPLGHPPSREAIEDWAQYVNAVRYPTRIAQNLAAISVQQVETLRTVHPRFYELLQQRMIEGLSRAQQTGEPLDDTFLMRIGLLFPDLDGAASPVFSREFGKVVRDYNQQQRQQQGSKGAGKPGKPTPSPMLSTLQNGATFGSGF